MHTPSSNDGAVVLAPVSPAVAALLHQLEAEAIERLEALPAPGSIVITPEPPARAKRWHHHENSGCREVRGQTADFTYKIALRSFFGEGAWVHELGHEPRFGRWSGEERRIDTSGRMWEAYVGYHVIDNFGDLVPVQ